jgi:hypothetical protein
MSHSNPTGWRRAETFVLYGALFFYSIFIVRNAFRVNGEVFFSLFDDAMISMSYARNLAEGYGLVWNAGEPAVEGYTNFLWTLVMAGAHKFGLPDSKVSLLVELISGACLFANAWVVARIADTVSKGNALARFFAFTLTLLSYALIFWSLRGMEVGFLALFVDVCILAAIRLTDGYSGRDLAMLCGGGALALLTRPDAIVPLLVLGAYCLLTLRGSARWKVVISFALSAGLTVGAHTLLRWVYYHDTLPNTYYLKVAGTPLSARLSTGIPPFIKTLLLEIWPILVLPLGLAIRSPLRMADHRRRLLYVMLGVQCVYSMYVGGDAWEHLDIANRYISIALPGAFVLVGTLLGDIFADGEAREIKLLAWLIVGGIVACLPGQLALHFLLAEDSHHYLKLKGVAGYLAADFAVLGIILFARRFHAAKSAVPSLLLPGLAVLGFFLLIDGVPFLRWTLRGEGADDEEMTRLGVAVAEVTQPQARIGVVYAGAPPYFSRRPSVDLLGKCDVVIAHQPSHLPFLPGHSKWDYEHSIRTYHPDMLLQTWRLTAANRAFLASEGYVRLPNGVYFLRGSKAASEEAVAALPFQMRHNYEVP